jgi:hypothetical protein
MRAPQHKVVQEGNTWVFDGYLRESDGTIHGMGACTYPGGGVYEGEFKDTKMNGRGKYTWPNGHVYEGEWKDGKKNGQGTLTYASGRRESGRWSEDKFMG